LPYVTAYGYDLVLSKYKRMILSVMQVTDTKPSSVNVSCDCLRLITYSSQSVRYALNSVRTHMQGLRRNIENYLLHIYASDSHPKQLCDDYHLLFKFYLTYLKFRLGLCPEVGWKQIELLITQLCLQLVFSATVEQLFVFHREFCLNWMLKTAL
jgi:hypothetical protein